MLVSSHKSKTKPAEVLLPKGTEKDPITHEKLTCQEGKTKPPPLHNESSILGAMETAGKEIEDETLREAMKECGLGTPATRAQILERLIQVKYIFREKNTSFPNFKRFSVQLRTRCFVDLFNLECLYGSVTYVKTLDTRSS